MVGNKMKVNTTISELTSICAGIIRQAKREEIDISELKKLLWTVADDLDEVIYNLQEMEV